MKLTYITRVTLISLLLGVSVAVAQEGSGVFRAAMQTNPPTLDVMTTTTYATRQATFYFLEPLITYDEDFNIVPMLADSWEISDDLRQYTFYLREGVPFHNGDEMKAEDVKASLERFAEVSPRSESFQNIDSIEIVDDYTVVLNMMEPAPTLLPALASPISYTAIMPKEIIEGKGVGDLSVADYIGTGPYRLESWEPDRYIHLVRFEDYAVDEDTPMSGLVGAKIAEFAEIYLMPVTEPGARVAGLISGEYDYAEALPTTQYAQLQSNPNITTYITTPGVWYLLEFNHANEWSGDLTFRKAIQAALDMEEIARAMTAGQEEFYRLQPSIFFNEQELWWNEAGDEYYNQDNVDEAKRLLEESGYNGEEIVLLTNRDYDAMYKGVLATANQLETKLGMNVKVEIYDWPGQRAFENNETGWHITPTFYSLRFDPSDFDSVFHSSAERKFYANPEMDEALEEGSSRSTPEERLEAYEEVQRIFYEDVVGLKLADVFSLE
ncbi:MAG: ABC transporter substrate-binding protein, partial [Deinococcota bacterium]|nr:ABC transporter substrate-binding protein [Deinococcota bacterium]